jgi:hypothetical protein
VGLQVSKIVFAPNDFASGERAAHKRCPAAGGDSNHHIAGFIPPLIQSECAGALFIFRAFHTSMQRRDSAGDYSLHKMRRRAEGGRDFACVQNADAPAAARADVK